MGADGLQLLSQLWQPTTSEWLHQLGPVKILWQVWLQQFYAADGPVRWRSADDLLPSTLLICSPYDPEARYSEKRDMSWTGYRVHFTETCAEDAPNLITYVTTTLAPVSDATVLPTIQTNLAARDVLPEE